MNREQAIEQLSAINSDLAKNEKIIGLLVSCDNLVAQEVISAIRTLNFSEECRKLITVENIALLTRIPVANRLAILTVANFLKLDPSLNNQENFDFLMSLLVTQANVVDAIHALINIWVRSPEMYNREQTRQMVVRSVVGVQDLALEVIAALPSLATRSDISDEQARALLMNNPDLVTEENIQAVKGAGINGRAIADGLRILYLTDKQTEGGFNDTYLFTDESIKGMVTAAGQNSAQLAYAIRILAMGAVSRSFEIALGILNSSGPNAVEVARAMELLEKSPPWSEGVRTREEYAGDYVRLLGTNNGKDAIEVAKLMIAEKRDEMLFLRQTAEELAADVPPEERIGALRHVFTLLAEQPSATDVMRQASQGHERFYLLPPSRQGQYDTAVMGRTDATHAGPELRKMLYLIDGLQKSEAIPGIPAEIQRTIEGLIDFVKHANYREILGESMTEDSQRLFAMGIDRLLRLNERVTSSREFGSRALVLGIFNYIMTARDKTPEEKNLLLRAFIHGVGNVIAAANPEDSCSDLICITAKAKGFFQGNPDLTNTSGVAPECHGRLKNLSMELSVLLGYPETLGEELKWVITNLSEDAEQELVAMLTKARGALESGDEFPQVTGSLYAEGINDQYFCAIVQIVTNLGELPVGVTPKEAGEIRKDVALLDGAQPSDRDSPGPLT